VGPLALALATLLATPTLAQIIPAGSLTADILLSTAIPEHRVFLSCSLLDGLSHLLITQGWQTDVQTATAILTANNVPAGAIAAFTEVAKPENLLPAEHTPFAEVNRFCDAHPDWQTEYYRLMFTVLDLKLPKVFE